MSRPCKHGRRSCLSCLHGASVAAPAFTDFERRKACRFGAWLVRYRDACRRIGRDPVAVLMVLIERRTEYADLALAYRLLVLRGGPVTHLDTADRMRNALVSRLTRS